MAETLISYVSYVHEMLYFVKHACTLEYHATLRNASTASGIWFGKLAISLATSNTLAVLVKYVSGSGTCFLYLYDRIMECKMEVGSIFSVFWFLGSFFCAQTQPKFPQRMEPYIIPSSVDHRLVLDLISKQLEQYGGTVVYHSPQQQPIWAHAPMYHVSPAPPPPPPVTTTTTTTYTPLIDSDEDDEGVVVDAAEVASPEPIARQRSNSMPSIPYRATGVDVRALLSPVTVPTEPSPPVSEVAKPATIKKPHAHIFCADTPDARVEIMRVANMYTTRGHHVIIYIITNEHYTSMQVSELMVESYAKSRYVTICVEETKFNVKTDVMRAAFLAGMHARDYEVTVHLPKTMNTRIQELAVAFNKHDPMTGVAVVVCADDTHVFPENVHDFIEGVMAQNEYQDPKTHVTLFLIGREQSIMEKYGDLVTSYATAEAFSIKYELVTGTGPFVDVNRVAFLLGALAGEEKVFIKMFPNQRMFTDLLHAYCESKMM